MDSDPDSSAPVTPDPPVWSRPESLPPAGPGPWGWVDRKGKPCPCQSFEDLAQAIIRDAGARVDLVWTPDSPHLQLPEEVPQLHHALREARIRWAVWEQNEGKRQMAIFGGFFLILLLLDGFDWQKIRHDWRLGVCLLLFFILGAIPWYQGIKRHRRASSWASRDMAEDVPILRFETWLSIQPAPLTRFLLILLALVGVAQLLCKGPPGITVSLAGLTKHLGSPADPWRLLTAPLLHGHPIHFLLNASALAYIGRRMECLTRWPHLLIVFLLSAWIGGEASAYFVPLKPSIGASGAIMGLLGFLLVFESLHPNLVPQSARRRLFAGLVTTVIIGILGYSFIDNAAHMGGLLAGMLYAFLVFPRSTSSHRPVSHTADLIFGSLSAVVLIGAALFAISRFFLHP